MADSIDRRSFLKVASLAGGGLMVGLYLDVPDGFAQTLGRDPGLLPNAFVRIAADGMDCVARCCEPAGQGGADAAGGADDDVCV